MAVETVQVDGRTRALALVRAVPVWAWLTGLVVVSAGIRYWLSRQAVAPWIMVDELIYSDLAKSFASTGQFLVRGHSTAAYGIVYPLVISPAWAIFRAVPDAYAAAKAINAFVMSLAAVPAYFLARRLLGQWLSLLAAGLALAIPSMVYTGTLMTENAFYPIFLCAVLALVMWLEQPTPLRTVVLLALCGVAYLTRQQALALLPALLTAPLLASGRRAFRDYRLTYGAIGAAVVLVLIVQIARGASIFGVFGAYEVVSHQSYTVGGVTRWFVYHVAELDLMLGVLPFAALLLLAVLRADLSRRTQQFVAASLALTFWLVLEVAAFASRVTIRIEERNMFYLTPLFLIALLVWIDRGLPRPGRAAAAAVLVAVALPGALPFASLIDLHAVSDTIALLPLWALTPHPLGLPQLGAFVVLLSIGAGLLLLFLPRRFALLLPALLLVYFAVSQRPIEARQRTAAIGALYAGITASQRDWVDRAVGRDARVAEIWTGNTDRFAIWENEIFNRSIHTVYRTAPAISGGLAEPLLTPDLRTGLLKDGGKPVYPRYVLTDRSLTLAGSIVASDVKKGMLLYRIDGALRQTTRVEGVYPQDTWSGPEVTYTRLDCTGGSLSVALQSDPSLFRVAQTVIAFEGGREVGRARIRPGTANSFAVPLHPAGRSCVVLFKVAPTAIPAVITHGKNPDPRNLGVHFNTFTYRS